MDAIDRLFDLYNFHMDRLDEDRCHSDNLYGRDRREKMNRMARPEFRVYVTGSASEAKRLHILRILNGDEQLAAELAETIQLLRPAA